MVEPTPAIKDNRYKTYSAITFDCDRARGCGAKTKLLIFYNSDDTAEEQGWMYVPLLRRVRARRATNYCGQTRFLGK